VLHRMIYGVLEDGVQRFIADPTMLDELFKTMLGLEDTETATIKSYFLAHPPAVFNGYMRRDAKFPCFAIVLGQEQETEQVLNRYMGRQTDETEDHYGADVIGSIWNYVYHIFTYTEHPDITSYYYEIAKAILNLSIQQFLEYGIFDLAFSGMDLAPDLQYLPEHLFVRQLQMTFQKSSQHINPLSTLGKAFKVAGIHVDKSGSPSDPGEVKTLISTYSTGGA